MGLLDGEPRTATVVALEDTNALELAAGTLAEICGSSPRSLLHILSARIRSTDELIIETVRPSSSLKTYSGRGMEAV